MRALKAAVNKQPFIVNKQHEETGEEEIGEGEMPF
jgi:hypothetical protein